jgi:fumarate reductase flavoprotein subunit
MDKENIAMKQVETDVVVVAAGTAGMAAAVAAAEKGAKVVVFEKASTVGGAGNMARGPFAVESFLSKQRKIAFTKEEAFKLQMDYTHWRVDARLVSAFINKSASTIDWLAGMGVKFIDIHCHNYSCKFTWHIIDGPLTPPEIPATGVVMMKILAERFQKLGGKFYLRTPVKKLIKEGGKVTGVIAEDETGEEIRAKAKAVIIATGGCGGNPEMIKKYTGWDMPVGPVPTATGDGIRMAWEAGAAPTDIYMHGGAGGTEGIGQRLHLAQVFSQPNLVINLQGDRFMSEEVALTSPFGSNPFLLQKNKSGFGIFDEDTKNYYMQEGLDFPMGILYADPIVKADQFDAEFKKAMDDGLTSIFTANSIEEMADKTGIDKTKLKATIDEYNHVCDTGRDEIFHKNPKFLRPIRKPKFYICKKGGAHSLGSLGGIRINYKTEVVAKDFNVIPGLYAAGLDANSINGDTYIFWLPGSTLGFALNSGRMAGENAADYVKSV